MPAKRSRGRSGPLWERSERFDAMIQLHVHPSKSHAPKKICRVQINETSRLSNRLIVAARIEQHRGQARVVDYGEGIQVDCRLKLAHGVIDPVDCHEIPPAEQMRVRIAGIEGERAVELPPRRPPIPLRG